MFEDGPAADAMYAVTATTEIAAPPEAVWAVLDDPARYPEIADPTDRMLEVPEGPLAEGAVYREYGGIPPFKGESTWEVTAYEPHRRQLHVGDDGSATMRLDVTLEPTDGGTRYTQRLEMELRPLLRPVMAVLWPLLMRGRAQAAMDRTVENVRRVAEAAAAD